MKSKDKKLTSVRIHPELFNDFKLSCEEDNFTFQTLAERAIFLYLTDEEFKIRVTNLNKLRTNK